MKKVKLKKLVLENFKGRTMSLDFSDRTVIRGTNESGKSTIANAIHWLIEGVDSQDRTNYDLYDSTKEFTPENAIPAVVIGILDVDGCEYELKKTAKQKWTRPRGKSEYVKDKSDEYMFYFDGLAVSANAYKDRIESLLAPIDKLKLMLNVRHYQMLDWKKLRKHFSDIVGIITEEELSGDYSVIADLLKKHGSTGVVKEKLRQEINPKKDANKTIEAEIKGMKSMLPDTSGVDAAAAAIAEKQDRIAEIDREIMGLGEANRPFVEKRKAEEAAIRAKKEEFESCRREWDEEHEKELTAIKKEIAEVDSSNAYIRKTNEEQQQILDSLKNQLEVAQHQAQFQGEELDRLRKENAEIKSRTFNENQTCKTCGQPLPADKVAQIREQFYDNREREHNACVEKGIRVKNNLAKQNEIIEDLKKRISCVLTDSPLLSKANLEMALEKKKSEQVPFEESHLYAKFMEELETMKDNLTVVPEVNAAELVAEKNNLNSEIKELQKVVATKSERERGEKRIEAKEQEQSALGVELARLEGLYNKCVEREREWASIVRDRANKYLAYAHVEMQELSKAGEVTDACTLTARKVGSGGTNTATQVLIGVDVACAFQKNAGLELPIIIDNAEQIVDGNMPKLSNQLIAFYVDENYPTLTIC